MCISVAAVTSSSSKQPQIKFAGAAVASSAQKSESSPMQTNTTASSTDTNGQASMTAGENSYTIQLLIVVRPQSSFVSFVFIRGGG